MAQRDDQPVFMAEADDPAMLAASASARASFRYFWRELAWERRRIVPALELACVKAPFSDGDQSVHREAPAVEQMWVSEIDFDGEHVTGVLINSPNWITSVSEGDSVSLELDDITDWMYAIDGQVYGAHTVNVLRARMPHAERDAHDAAWGLDFGDPREIRLMPPERKAGFVKKLFGRKAAPVRYVSDDIARHEHPMSLNMAASLKEALAADPKMVHAVDERGWTLLHHQALAGSATCVTLLLEHGADRTAVTAEGKTALDLAKVLGWDHVASLLTT